MANELTAKERYALAWMADSLVKMRAMIRRSKRIIGLKGDLDTLHDLADAWHNLPRILAEGTSAQNEFLIDAALEHAANIYRRKDWRCPPNFAVTVPGDMEGCHVFQVAPARAGMTCWPHTDFSAASLRPEPQGE